MIPLNSNSTIPLKYQKSSGTCKESYDNFLNAFLGYFENVTFTINTFQFFLVTLMYINVGKGKYWKILYYAALSGLIGGLVENGTVAYVCTQNEENVKRFYMVPFLLNEVFWIFKEYSVPFLNLIKLRAFINGRKSAKFIEYIIYFLFVLFVACRFYIGYVRMTSGLLKTTESRLGHTAAFVVMALADIICTVSILFFVRKHNHQNITYNNNIDHYIKRSSYMTLIFVDLIGIILAFFNFTTAIFKTNFPESYINPFQAVKSSFILILACDAMVFKYSVTSSSRDRSSNYNNNNMSKESLTFNNGYNSNLSMKMSQSRSIVKNYTNNQNSSSNSVYDFGSPTINIGERYLNHGLSPSQSFGFLAPNK